MNETPKARAGETSRVPPDYPPDFDPAHHDVRDPDTWLALYLDQSIPLDEQAKLALLRSMRRTSRKALLPFMRPWARLWIILITVLRLILPSAVSSSKALHRFIHWGLKTFVSPEANTLILRHFHIGTELLQFIKDNVPGAVVETVPLRPTKLSDLIDNVFLQHDLNIYNFVIDIFAPTINGQHGFEVHRKMLAAIVARDPMGAAEAEREHTETWKRTRKAL